MSAQGCVYSGMRSQNVSGRKVSVLNDKWSLLAMEMGAACVYTCKEWKMRGE